MNAKTELKPCPFCGWDAMGPVQLGSQASNWWQCGCESCDFWFQQEQYEAVVDMWNRRANEQTEE